MTNNLQIEKLREKYPINTFNGTTQDELIELIVHQLELAKIEAKIEERELIKRDICPPILANDRRISELTKQKEEIENARN